MQLWQSTHLVMVFWEDLFFCNLTCIRSDTGTPYFANESRFLLSEEESVRGECGLYLSDPAPLMVSGHRDDGPPRPAPGTPTPAV